MVGSPARRDDAPHHRRKEREMAVDIDRDPMAFAVENDPMRSPTRIHNGQRPVPAVADPAPLGLAALAMTTLVFSVFNTGLVSRTGEPVVLGLAIAYGGLTQLLAGMWEFRRGNAFGALTFGSYGAFWLSFWVLEQFMVKQIPTAEAGSAIALYFITWAVFTALLWVASLRTTPAVSVMLALLGVTLLLLGIGDAGAHSELVKIAGWFGIATAAAGLYAAFGALINSTYERTVLPLRPVRRAP
jgi:succinate-acetate transporter protein